MGDKLVEIDGKLDRVLADLKGVLELDFQVRQLRSYISELNSEINVLKDRFKSLEKYHRYLKSLVHDFERVRKDIDNRLGELRGVLENGLEGVYSRILDSMDDSDDDDDMDNLGSLLREFADGV